MKLHQVAHSRSGDKGDTSNISVIAFDPEDFAFLAEHVTADFVADHFGDAITGTVTRYELPALGALNFVLTGALGGGVVRSLALDMHGKSLSSALLEFELPDKGASSGSP
ncbi:AtuA-related protein [Tardiphaga sp. 768_D3_N2_1]|uniref:AtuA-related protein n=1 Tax=Tardiphaga sp. 768_D3_N2_1 TaxID=3240783 RepID=UPI003F88716F